MPLFLSLFISIQISPVMIAGIGTWAITLYFSFSGLSDRITESIEPGLARFQKSLFSATAPKQLEPEPSYLTFWASVLGILPFVGAGAVCYFCWVWGLGESWAVSFGIMGILTSGVYALGRRSGEFLD